MTFNKPSLMTFGKFFGQFLKYWNFRRNKNGYHDQRQINILTSICFAYLREEWDASGCDIDELKWICYNLDYNNELFDPYNFIDDKFAYVNHVKKCYHLENNE